MRFPIVLLLVPMLSGCLARTAVDVVSLPVHAVGKGVDWATTSQAESDRNRGRMMRKEEARIRKEQRKEARERARDDARDAREARRND